MNKILRAIIISLIPLTTMGALTVNNGGGATNITSTSAWITATVASTGAANPSLFSYWGTNDGGTNASSWKNTNSFGVCTQATYSFQATGLSASKIYYFRSFATNGAETNWATYSAQFITLTVPTSAPPSSVQNVTVDTNDVLKHPGTNFWVTNKVAILAGIGAATGSPVYVESDPIWATQSNLVVYTNSSVYTDAVAKAGAAYPANDPSNFQAQITENLTNQAATNLSFISFDNAQVNSNAHFESAKTNLEALIAAETNRSYSIETNIQAQVTSNTTWKVSTNDPSVTNARPPLAHDQGWSTITGTPVVVGAGGYGVTDVYTKVETDGKYVTNSVTSHTNLTDINGDTNVQHLTLSEKSMATNLPSWSGWNATQDVTWSEVLTTITPPDAAWIPGINLPASGKIIGVIGTNLYAILSTNFYRMDAAWSYICTAPIPDDGSAFASDGTNIFIIGGYIGASVAVTNVYRFDGSACVETVGLPAARFYLGAAFIGTNLYVAAGLDENSAPTKTVWRRDGTEWTAVADMPQVREDLSAGVIVTNLYAIGGWNLGPSVITNVYKFDGAAWEEVVGLPLKRASYALANFNSEIFIIGGYDDVDFVTNCYRFDGSAWTEFVGLPTAAHWFGGGAAAYNDRIYVSIGSNVYSYSPLTVTNITTNTWSVGPSNSAMCDKLNGSNLFERYALSNVFTRSVYVSKDRLISGISATFTEGLSNNVYVTGESNLVIAFRTNGIASTDWVVAQGYITNGTTDHTVLTNQNGNTNFMHVSEAEKDSISTNNFSLVVEYPLSMTTNGNQVTLHSSAAITNSYAFGTDDTNAFRGDQGASVSQQVAVLSTNTMPLQSGVNVSNRVSVLETNTATKLQGDTADAALPKAGGVFTGPVFMGTNRIYWGSDTNAPWTEGLGTTNIQFGAGTNRAIFGVPW
jgi:hypothetical protein